MKVVFTEQAYSSLEEVKSFLIKKQKLSEQKALEIVLHLVDCAEELNDFPNRGQVEDYLDHLGLDHRRIVVKHSKIIYRVTATAVYITDFFDTRQSPKTMQKKAAKPRRKK